MAGQQDTKKGPDLSLGVPVAEIPESGLLAGHVGDEAVVLARAGDEYFAIGASCPHYSGPLAGGLSVIRCDAHGTTRASACGRERRCARRPSIR